MLLVSSAPPVALPTPTPLWLAVTLIGAQLTGFFLREKEPCGPSVPARTMNRCHHPGCLSCTLPGCLNACMAQSTDQLFFHTKQTFFSFLWQRNQQTCWGSLELSDTTTRTATFHCCSDVAFSVQMGEKNTLQREDLWLDQLLPHGWRLRSFDLLKTVATVGHRGGSVKVASWSQSWIAGVPESGWNLWFTEEFQLCNWMCDWAFYNLICTNIIPIASLTSEQLCTPL